MRSVAFSKSGWRFGSFGCPDVNKRLKLSYPFLKTEIMLE